MASTSTSRPFAVDGEHDRVPAVRFDRGLQRVPARHRLPVDGDDAVALLQARLRGRALRDDGVDGGARALGDAAADDHHEEQEERDDQVHGDAGEHDLQAIAVAALPVGARLVGGVDLFEAAHPDDAHVAAERERLHAVLGLAALERPQPRSEPEEELGDLHARALAVM